MSQENVEIVRRVYEAWSRGDFRSTVDVYDSHVVFVDRMSIDAGAYLGREGLRGYMRKFLERWSEVTMDAEAVGLSE